MKEAETPRHHRGPDFGGRGENRPEELAAYGPDGASTGLKGEEAVRQIDLGEWWAGLFHATPNQAATAVISRLIL
jgi:hypothetical protein